MRNKDCFQLRLPSGRDHLKSHGQMAFHFFRIGIWMATHVLGQQGAIQIWDVMRVHLPVPMPFWVARIQQLAITIYSLRWMTGLASFHLVQIQRPATLSLKEFVFRTYVSIQAAWITLLAILITLQDATMGPAYSLRMAAQIAKRATSMRMPFAMMAPATILVARDRDVAQVE